MKVWLNNALIDSTAATIDITDRGFTLGDGLFETIAVRGGKALRLDAHLARMKDGCKILSLPLPTLSIAETIQSVLTANQLGDAVVRMTLTRGVAERGVLPSGHPKLTLLISATSMPSVPTPARCIIATVTRRNEHSPLSRVKSLNYLDSILARQEAQAQNADDAILLNTAGKIAEASAANLFMVRDNQVLTPPVTDGALPGIMRAAVLADTQGGEQSLEPNDLFNADALFLTSSLGIRLIESLNEKPAGTESGRSFVTKLMGRF